MLIVQTVKNTYVYLSIYTMWHFFKEKAKFFIGGAIAGVYPAIHLLFNNPNIYLNFVLRCFGAVVIAFLSGLVTVFAHDVYKHLKVKYKIFNNANQKDDENKAA